MDISDFLAAMQTDPGNKVLAKNTKVSMGIPEEDGADTSTDQSGADDMSTYQSGAGGYDVSGYDDGSESMGYAEGGPIPGVSHTSKRVASYADGGEVDDETEPQMVEQGAIPDEQEVTGSVTEQPQGPQAGEEDWRTDAMEGITDAIRHGYDERHAVNRPMTDDSHENDVREMLSGAGATPPAQVQAALQAVDPEGALDESTRLQKAIGKIYRHYNGNNTPSKTGLEGEGAGQQANAAHPRQPPSDPEMSRASEGLPADAGSAREARPSQGAQAVWGILQYARRAFDAYAGHATVAVDRGNMDQAASSAQSALNRVPDGLVTAIKWIASTSPLALPIRAARDMMGGGEQAPTTQGAQSEDQGAPAGPNGQPATGQFAINITDPETNKQIAAMNLTPPQLKHVLADGFDRALVRGTVNQVGAASGLSGGANLRSLQSARNRAQGQWWDGGQRDPTRGAEPEDQYVMPRVRFPNQGGGGGNENPNGQDHITMVRGGNSVDVPYGTQHGLPPDLDTRGMSVGQIARLRQQYATGRVANAAGVGGERERVADIAGNARVRGIQEQQRGLNGRVMNAPGQFQQNERALLTQTRAAVKAWVDSQRTPPSQEAQDAQFDRYMQFFRSRMQMPGQQQAPQPQPQAPQAPAPQQPGGAPQGIQYKNGVPYRFDAARGGWVRQGQ